MFITRLLRSFICPLCHIKHAGPFLVCATCQSYLIPIKQGCHLCQYPLIQPVPNKCGQCIKAPPAIDEAIIPFILNPPLQALIHEYKYKQGLYLTKFLVHLMLQAKPASAPTCVMPVPLHTKRLQMRGFNQSALLAKGLSKALNIPCLLTYSKKNKHTLPQAQISGVDRRKNLSHAFTCKPLPFEDITLVDDIYTTGSTAQELAKTLKLAGAKTVRIWCVARAIKKN